MEEKIKAIISRFTKIPAEQISAATVIDRTAVTGSILLHRMYAALATEGIVVENYWDIKNYGALLQRVNGTSAEQTVQTIIPSSEMDYGYVESTNSVFKGIGIDIEKTDSMPIVNDYREEAFYKMNFTAEEIAYCILQPSATASFAGLFAAKEAIVKANNSYKTKPFNQIRIDHLPNGKPVHKEFQLSISHTNEVAVAMAAFTGAVPEPAATSMNTTIKAPAKNKSSITFVLAIAAFILSLTAFILLLFHH